MTTICVHANTNKSHISTDGGIYVQWGSIRLERIRSQIRTRFSTSLSLSSLSRVISRLSLTGRSPHGSCVGSETRIFFIWLSSMVNSWQSVCFYQWQIWRPITSLAKNKIIIIIIIMAMKLLRKIFEKSGSAAYRAYGDFHFRNDHLSCVYFKVRLANRKK